MDIENKLLRSMVGRFDGEMQLKADLAGWFIRDGSDLLETFAMGWKSDRNNLSYRSKLFINLRMAIECYLKGLVIVYSKKAESPEDAFRVAREPSHDLAMLLAEVRSRNKRTNEPFKKASAEFIAQVGEMRVGLRYEADLTAAFSRETFEQQMLESGPMSGSIGSDEWMLCLRQHATYIGEKAGKEFRRRFGKHRKRLGGDYTKLWIRRQQFMTNVGLGCFGTLPNPQAAGPLLVAGMHKSRRRVHSPIACEQKTVYKCQRCNAVGCRAPDCSNRNFDAKSGRCMKCGHTKHKAVK